MRWVSSGVLTMQWQQSQACRVGWLGDVPVREEGPKDWTSGEERRGVRRVLIVMVLVGWWALIWGWVDGWIVGNARESEEDVVSWVA